ncbi:MAG: type II toxin-antitoxin system VapC family toxin, partial [Kiloniellales bacterium]
MSFVVDASVAIKWFVEEDQSEEALRLLEREEPFYAPDLIVAEVTNIAWKKAIRDEIERDQAQEIANAIRQGVPALYPSAELNERALEIGLTFNQPIYDCLYIACAEAVDGVLVTTDQKLLNTTKGTNFEGRVRHLGWIGESADPIPALQISTEKVERVIELTRRSRDTASNVISNTAGDVEGGVRMASSELTEMMINTPVRRQLIEYVDSLSREERADLLALFW